MGDNINIYTIHDLDWQDISTRTKFSYNNLIFYPIHNKGRVSTLRSEDELGFRHIIGPYKYYIKNSVHKAYSKLIGKSGNHDFFGYNQFCEMIYYLSERYNLDLDKTYISKVEIAVNINVKYEGENYFNKVYASNLNPINFLRKANRVYGIKVYRSKENYKLYDKTLEVYLTTGVKLNQNILRFECELKNSVLLKRLAPTLSQIINPQNYGELLSHLYFRFTSFRFSSSHDLSNLNSSELKNYFAGKNSKFWKHLNARNTNTYKTTRQKHKDILKKLDESYINDPLLLELRKEFKNAIYKQANNFNL